MLGTIKALSVVYIVMLVGAFLSELLYKKKPVNEVVDNIKTLIIKTTITFAVLIVASYLYYNLLDRPK